MTRGSGKRKRKGRQHQPASNVERTETGPGGFVDPLFPSATSYQRDVREVLVSSSEPSSDLPSETAWLDVSVSKAPDGTNAPPILSDLEGEEEEEEPVEGRSEEAWAVGWAALTDKILQGHSKIGFPAIYMLLVVWIFFSFWFAIQEAGRGRFETAEGTAQISGVWLCLTSLILLLIGIIVFRTVSRLYAVAVLVLCLVCFVIGALLLTRSVG